MIGLFSGLAIFGFAVTTFAATAVISLNEVAWHEVEEYCKRKNQPELFGKIFDHRERLALGANIFEMIASGIGAVGLIGWLLAGRTFAELPGFTLASLVTLVAFSFVVAGSWIPWAIATMGSAQFLVRTWRWWWVVSALAWPLLRGGQLVSSLFMRASGQNETEDDEEEAFEDEILSMVSEGAHDGYLESDARDMIEGVMELDDQDVAMVMTPRSKIDALDVSTSLEQAVGRVVDSGRTRIPIFDDKLDQIVGLVYAKDLLRETLRSEGKRRPLKKLLRTPMFVPETKALDDMLKVFLKGRMHMAIVQDEYGGVAGLVTIEDVLEEIVGEIEDETDNERDAEITIVDAGHLEVAGYVHLSRLNEEFGLQLPDNENYDTLAGLIMHQLNEIPRVGHSLSIDQVDIEILDANRRHIQKVRLKIHQDGEA